MVDKTAVPHFIRQTGKVAESFSMLAERALTELKVHVGKAEIVCGPISTGGWGDATVNLLVFNDAIEVLKHAGRPMWSQIPYEAGLAKLEHRWKIETNDDGYCHPILTEFYQPLFDASPRLIRRAWFIDGERGWETSVGAKWEHEKMLARGIDIEYFKHSWHCHVPELRHLD